MTVLSVRRSTSGRRAWTINAPAAVDLGAQAANLVTENAFVPPANAVVANFSIPLWARKAASPAGIFFSHTRLTGLNTAVIANGNSTAAPVDPGAENISIGTVHHDTMRSGPAGQFALGGLSVIAAGTGAIAAGNIAAHTSVARAITGCSLAGGANFFLLVSPRAALVAGLALDQGVLSAADPAIGSASIHNLTAGAVDPGAAVFDWVALVPTPNGSTARLPPSGPFFIRRFQATIDHGAIGALATLEATTVVTPRGLPILAPNTATNNLPVVYACPTAALPAGAALSHARVTADNTIAIGLSDVSGAGVNPAAVTYDIYVFTPPNR